MPYQDLREFLDNLESRGDLKHVRKEVDWNLELSHIFRLNEMEGGPALLFDNIKDCPGHRVAASVLQTKERVALALDLSPEQSFLEMVKQWHARISERTIPPQWVDSGPCKENIVLGDDVNLYDFPTPWFYPKDGGRYLSTGAILVTRDLETGRVNVGTYRGMIIDRDKMALLLSLGKDSEIDLRGYAREGRPMPVAWATGVDPALFICSANFFPRAVSEYDIAGALRGEPVAVVRGETVDLPIPAGAEIVLEGEVVPGELVPEGPFSEWPGYYTGGDNRLPYMRVKAITHRSNPILWAMHAISDPALLFSLARTAGLYNELQSMGIPGVKSVHCPRVGGGRMMAIISVQQMYPGHSTQVGLAVMASISGNYGLKIVIVVDDDIDPENWEQVLWALSMRYQPERCTQIIKRGKSTPLDPSLPVDGRMLTSRVLLDACLPYEWEHKPERIALDPEMVTRVKGQWDQYFAP